MEPSLAIISEVTTVFDEALSIAESVNDMVHLQDQSTFGSRPKLKYKLNVMTVYTYVTAQLQRTKEPYNVMTL